MADPSIKQIDDLVPVRSVGFRVCDLNDVPYDQAAWDAETVRDWLERTHQPPHARYIVTILRKGQRIKSRPFAPTVEVMLRPLLRITQLEQEIETLKQRPSTEV